jgi:hypothetical protein
MGLSITLKTGRIAAVLLCLGLLPAVGAPLPPPGTDDSVDAVTVKDEVAYAVRGDQIDLLTNALQLPFEVVVDTNGTFTVADGKERKLRDGQLLRRDGWILDPAGSIEPVFDHVAMHRGGVIVVRDGEAAPLGEPMRFPNNLLIGPDAWCYYPFGAHARLADGQLFRLDGSPVFARDTATLKNGHVVLQKDGALLSRMPIQITGMNDGTKVRGDGLIMQPDGGMFQLQEGETVLIEGRAARR